MKTFKRILFLVAVLSIPLMTYSGSSDSGYEPNIREIRMEFFSIEPIGGLQGGLYPNEYWSPIKEPNNFDFYDPDASYVDYLRLLRDTPYGSNNYSNDGTTYYYMHGGGSFFWDCLDEDNVSSAVAFDNYSIVSLTLDTAQGQYVWAQIMSQCHGESLGASDVDGKGFWYKFEEPLGTMELELATTESILVEFESMGITDCVDYVNFKYGCDPGDVGNTCEGCH